MAFLLIPVVMFGTLITFFVLSERRFKRAGYQRGRRPPSEIPGHSFSDGSSATLRGGARIRGMNATWPFATLAVDREWARLKAVIGTVWINRATVDEVCIVRGLMGPGVLFRTDTGIYDGVIFWTFAPQEVERAFTAFGWSVGR